MGSCTAALLSGPQALANAGVMHNRLETSDETAIELLKLVDEGAKFVISDDLEGGDFLTNFRERMGREGR